MKQILLAVALLATGAANATTVITADRYLDVHSGKYVEHPAIFIGDDGHINSIADARTVRWGADVKQIDLSGKTLVPGLIDMHVHLDNGKQFAKMVEWGMTPLQAIHAATRNASQALGRSDVGVIEVGRYGGLVAVTGDPTVSRSQ
jgi:imidazolonepropionase-like amidohydrolase